MKLAIIFPVLNQFSLAKTAIKNAVVNLGNPWQDVDVVVIDNGSDTLFSREYIDGTNTTFVRHENTGVYPTLWEALTHTDADILAFFHSDLIICEKDWDKRVLAEFERDPKLGLIGFIGSNQIDHAGGRGSGTTSNFQGGSYTDSNGTGVRTGWMGSPAKAHGRQDSGFSLAAVIDGCAMIFRREVLEKIAQRPHFPPHHFYDRLLSCETRERGYTMGVLGIACDHISGQTVNQEPKYHTFAETWCRANLAESVFLGNPSDYAWDATTYAEAERQWLGEYRDRKHLVPCRV